MEEQKLISQLEEILGASFGINSQEYTHLYSLTINNGQVIQITIGNHKFKSPDSFSDFVHTLSQFKSLNELVLYNCKIKDFTPLTTLTYLKRLSLYQDKITDIEFFRSFNRLESVHLTISNNANIQPLAECKKLKEICFDSMTGIDFSPLCHLTELKTLILKGCNIKNTETTLTGLKQIHKLEIDDCKLNSMEFIKELKELRGFNYHVKQNTTKLFPWLGELKNLEKLSLSFTPLHSLEGLKNLTKLTSLYIANCKIKDISIIENFTHLKNIQISSNPVTDISVLTKLPDLEELYMENIKPKDIKIISALKGLKKLFLSQTDIEDISFLKPLHMLQVLDISQNKIVDLRPLQTIRKLKALYALDNKIKDLSPLQELSSLEELVLSINEISDITPLQHLYALKFITLGLNHITDISPLKKLPNVNNIRLNNNRITSLPDWVLKFQIKLYDANDPESKIINIAGNPLTNPPMEIIEQGRDAIERYFERKKKEKFSSIREAKLILVGDGAAGKTSLRTRLRDSKADLPAEESRTRGIDVDDWEFRKGFTAHIWDFGGQDVYYPVHRFFMTKDAVFVLLASTRQENHNFEYWLPTIYQFGGSSPVIIGQTCHDGNTVPWNDLGKYISTLDLNIIKTSLQPYYELNLKKRNKGLSDIRKVITEQLRALPHCRKDVPVSWIRVRDLLKEIRGKNPCITYDRFTEICTEEFPEENLSPEAFEDCCNFLHRTGALFWYASNPLLKGYVILDPDWAVRAVYKIIDDEQIQKRKGHILTGDFTRLWKEPCYRNRYDILKQMLIVFRIAFSKKHKPEEFMIPARLISILEEKRFTSNPCIKLEYKYNTFMPRGIVNQLSAELSRYIVEDEGGNEEVWNNAVHFNSEDGACRVYEDFYNNQITLMATGFNPRGVLCLVMNVLKDIHDQYKGVHPEIMVPCSCSSCSEGTFVTRFEYSRLFRWYNERGAQATVVCNESGRELRISHLLNEVGLHTPHTSVSSGIKTPETIRIFLASSYELKEERELFEQYIGRKNKTLRKKNKFLHLDIWEDLPSHMSETRSQDEYNKAVRACDLFICLCFSRMGIYTKEEFDLANETFRASGKPSIYVFLKEPPYPAGIKAKELESRENFEKQLRELEYFPTLYKTPDGFINHMTTELERLLDPKE